MEGRRLVESLLVGAGGAAAVTLLHEGVRARVPSAPRMDLVGERALKRIARRASVKAPTGKSLYRWALLGELLGNTAYYALTTLGRPSHPLARGVTLGALAGVGALTLTPRLGLGSKPVRRSRATAAMTFCWYLAGGVVAGAVCQLLGPTRRSGR